MSYSNQSDRAWEKLSQVAVHGAVYDSGERLPHPKCLKDTRTNLLKHIYGFLDNPEKSQLVWLHGTAGVGKSAVAFTVAERMRDLKMSEDTTVSTRLAGTFFFSRTNTNRRTTGYLFATLAHQIARNFSCVRTDVCKAIIENPAILEPNSSLRDQMEALFLRPLRQLYEKRENCPPLSFVIDALDECTSEAELTELISLLGKALHKSNLPKLHILLTSRSEAHVRRAMEDEEVHPLVCDLPVKTSGDGVPDIISLDGADVDNDIYVFFNHSFRNLRDRHRDFPQPTQDQLVKLATRAGRRFIVASTMMKFINDGHNDPRGRLQIMLDLTSHLLPGTEVYRLYDRILSTCADPNRAYMHLSVVATLADPLPASQISKLLGPGEGNDVETTLVQLRSIMDIPTDGSLPVNIYHSSVRDYVSNPSNCSLPNLHYIAPHFLLAYSSVRLMIQDIPASTALLDGLVELKRHSKAISSEDPRKLRQSLVFVVQPLESLQVLSGLLWVRGDDTPVLRCWLETPDGRAWLETADGRDWLQNEFENDDGLAENRENWFRTEGGHGWLATENGKDWLKRYQFWLRTEGGENWLQTQAGQNWLQTNDAKEWVRDDLEGKIHTEAEESWLQTEDGTECIGCVSCEGIRWVDTEAGKNWLETQAGQCWLQSHDAKYWLPNGGWLPTQAGQHWLQTQAGKIWLQTETARQNWLLTTCEGGDWLQTQSGGDWLQTQSRGDWMVFEYFDGIRIPIVDDSREEGTWLQTPGGRAWLQTQSIQDWLETSRGRCWLRAQHKLDWLLPEGGRGWLETEGGSEWLKSRVGKDWLWTKGGQDWVSTEGGNAWLSTKDGKDWLSTEAGEHWLQSRGGKHWLSTEGGKEWVQTEGGKEWVQTEGGKDWVQMQGCVEMQDWLLTKAGQDCLRTQAGKDWLRTQAGQDWLQTQAGQDWLQTQAGQDWLKSWAAQGWLNTLNGQGWLQTQAGRDWLQTQATQDWLKCENARRWLDTQDGQDWLQTQNGTDWRDTQDGWEWLDTQDGWDWLQTQAGKDWLQTQAAQDWLKSWRGWLDTQDGQGFLRTLAEQDLLKSWDAQYWLKTWAAQLWLQTPDGWDWLQTQAGKDWLQTQTGQEWLKLRSAHWWLSTQGGCDWLQTQAGRDWLQTQSVQGWLKSGNIFRWLKTQDGRDLLQTQGGRDWLQTQSGRFWLGTQGGEDWLQTESGRGWLQTPHAEAWPLMGVWVTIVEFWSALEGVSQYPIVPDLPCLPAFQVIQHLKSLPDFLMFPVFLALRHHNNSMFSSPQDHLPDVEIIRAMKVFVNIANSGRERSQSASDALKYACHNWAIHLARAPRPWDTMLRDLFYSFWNRHLLYWLEMQWCLKGLQACLAVLYEGELLVWEYLSQTRESNT